MRLILLGAGASKAYSQSPTGLRMPIAHDFFNTFEKMDIYAHPWVLRDGLLDFICRVKGEDPIAYLGSGIDIEKLYSEIEEHLIESYQKEKIERVIAFKPYTQLTFIFSAVINEIQNGPPSSAHLELAKRLTRKDSIITFNWDTLMDRALHIAGGWSVDSGYGFSPRSIHRGTWCAPDREQPMVAPRLIKLHGSTNWLTSHPIGVEKRFELTQQAAPDTVWVYENTDGPYSCFAGRYLEGYQDFSYGYYPPNIMDDPGKSAPDGHLIFRARPRFPWMPEGGAEDKGLVSMPLIIPPVRYKKYSEFGMLFDELWAEAERGIQEASHIVIVGYSFPDTDVRSTELFLSALSKRGDIPKVTLLDPQPDKVAHKLRMQFGIPDSNLRVFREYFSESTNMDDLLCF